MISSVQPFNIENPEDICNKDGQPVVAAGISRPVILIKQDEKGNALEFGYPNDPEPGVSWVKASKAKIHCR